MNFEALLCSTYVETLCNTLSRLKGKARDRLVANRGRGNGRRLMWIPCLRGAGYKGMFLL